MCQKEETDILILTETWLNEQLPEQIDNKLIQSPPAPYQGVITLGLNQVSGLQPLFPALWTPMLTVTIATLANQQKVAVVAFYNQPGFQNVAEEELETLTILIAVHHPDLPLICGGDFNKPATAMKNVENRTG